MRPDRIDIGPFYFWEAMKTEGGRGIWSSESVLGSIWAVSGIRARYSFKVFVQLHDDRGIAVASWNFFFPPLISLDVFSTLSLSLLLFHALASPLTHLNLSMPYSES